MAHKFLPPVTEKYSEKLALMQLMTWQMNRIIGGNYACMYLSLMKRLYGEDTMAAMAGDVLI